MSVCNPTDDHRVVTVVDVVAVAAADDDDDIRSNLMKKLIKQMKLLKNELFCLVIHSSILS